MIPQVPTFLRQIDKLPNGDFTACPLQKIVQRAATFFRLRRQAKRRHGRVVDCSQGLRGRDIRSLGDWDIFQRSFPERNLHRFWPQEINRGIYSFHEDPVILWQGVFSFHNDLANQLSVSFAPIRRVALDIGHDYSSVSVQSWTPRS